MIQVCLQLANEQIVIEVNGNNVLFNPIGGGLSPIDGLKLSKAGVIKEFPDLDGVDDWKQQAIKRFKEKIKSFNTEREKINYIIADLGKHGYVAKYIQRNGHRPEVYS